MTNNILNKTIIAGLQAPGPFPIFFPDGAGSQKQQPAQKYSFDFRNKINSACSCLHIVSNLKSINYLFKSLNSCRHHPPFCRHRQRNAGTAGTAGTYFTPQKPIFLRVSYAPACITLYK